MLAVASSVVRVVVAIALSLSAVISTTAAFVLPNDRLAIPLTASRITSTSLVLTASMIEEEAPKVANGTSLFDNEPTKINEAPRTSLDVRIHGQWYDLTGWRKAHPAGVHWLDWYDGRDATEVMDGFHSAKGRRMYSRLPKSKEATVKRLEVNVPPDSKAQIAFRKLREELERDGWWNRDLKHEYTILGIWGGLVASAAVVSKAFAMPALGTVLLSLSMTAAGWLGHDYIHGVDPFADRLRNFAALAAGLYPLWWSDKHNKHHAMTNEQGVDEDIATDPFLFQWAPSPENDHPLRKIQHLIFYVPFSFLFALWRFDSIKDAIADVRRKRKGALPVCIR